MHSTLSVEMEYLPCARHRPRTGARRGKEIKPDVSGIRETTGPVGKLIKIIAKVFFFLTCRALQSHARALSICLSTVCFSCYALATLAFLKCLRFQTLELWHTYSRGCSPSLSSGQHVSLFWNFLHHATLALSRSVCWFKEVSDGIGSCLYKHTVECVRIGIIAKGEREVERFVN